MQFSATKRTGKTTYGKASRNVVHDLFDHRASRDVVSSTNSHDAVIATAPKSDIADVSHRVAYSDRSQKASTTHKPSNVTQISKPSALNLENNGLYDMQSSDDDVSSDTSGSRTSKRQRTSKSILSTKTSNPKASQVVAAKSQRAQDVTTISSKTAVPALPVSKSTSISKKAPALALTKKMSNTRGKSRPKSTKLPEAAAPQTLSSIVKSKATSPVPQKEDVVMVDELVDDIPEYLSDHSRQSATLATITPKRKRPSPVTTDSEVSSPSHLGMTALKLNSKGLSPAPPSPGLSSDGSAVQKKGRRRLIDRLDAPSNSAGQTSEEHVSDEPTSSTTKKTSKSIKTYGRTAHNETKGQIPRSTVVSEGSDKSQSKAGWPVKPRATYATQRSYLNDMVDELDILSAPSSQNSTDQLFLPPSKSNLASQLNLESEDSEDMAGASKLKSIHELRRAGAVTRFDREVDALLEDIGVNEQSSQALRLQASMKLTGRLRDLDFLRHLATSGRVQRLTASAVKVEDLPSLIVLGIALTSLSKSENVTLEVLDCLVRAATDIAPAMLADARSLSKIAKDRKENLSKATVRDLAEFEKSTVESSEDMQSHTNYLCADIVAMDLLEQTLRKMIQLGNTSARLSTQLYSQILRILCLQTQYLEGREHDSFVPKKLEAALSLLELCSVVTDDTDLRVTDDDYISLGDALAEIVSQNSKLRKPLEQGVLRVVVSLSNNKPRLCRLFGATQISKAAFGIVNDNFLNLAKQAEDEEDMDQSKLDSVVLALGSLLNFAESDSTLRTRLAEMKLDHNHPVTQLVSIFNSQVSKVDEALTKEQGQVSVAFGYLSMLLCALSLHPLIKKHVTQLLKRRSFEELCTAARKFFSHLQTLEHITDDDASMSTFIARFEAILETVQDTSME